MSARGSRSEVGFAAALQHDLSVFQPGIMPAGEVIERAGTVIAHDGGVSVATPEDNMMLIMPTRRLDKGLTAVRLGRLVDGTQDPNPAPPLTA